MRLLLLFTMLTGLCFASENFINMKNCETIKLSKFTALVSCHKIDYLVEYRIVDDEEKDTIKKITAITQNEQRVIKSLGR